MWFGLVCNLITHPWLQRKTAAVLELGMQLARGTQNNVSLRTPMIGDVTGRVIDHAHANCSELLSAPISNASPAGVLCSFNL